MQFVSSVSIDGPVLHKIQKMLGEFVKVIFWSKLIRVRTDKTQCTLVGVYIGCVYIVCTLCVHCVYIVCTLVGVYIGWCVHWLCVHCVYIVCTLCVHCVYIGWCVHWLVCTLVVCTLCVHCEYIVCTLCVHCVYIGWCVIQVQLIRSI